jgi:hypothetical protein
VAAVLPGVFALMLAGVSGVAAGQTSSPSPTATPAAATSPSPTPTCHRHRPPYCPTPTPTPTPTPSPTATPIANGGMGGAGNGVTSTPTPQPTSTPAPRATSTPTASPSGTSGAGTGSAPGGVSGGGQTGGSRIVSAGRLQIPSVLAPFAPLSASVGSLNARSGLDAARIPPVEALTPLGGVTFGNGLNLGPLLLLIDMIGIGLLVYLVRTRWLTPEV